MAPPVKLLHIVTIGVGLLGIYVLWLNLALANFLVTSAVSLRDVQVLFATLNLPTPNEPGLFKNMKKQSLVANNIANKQPDTNRDIVKQIASYKGKDKDKEYRFQKVQVPIETDKVTTESLKS